MGTFFGLNNFHPKYGVRLVRRLTKQFGYKFVILIGSMFLTQDAMMGDLVRNGEFPYYREAGVGLETRTEMGIISASPDNFKSLIGLLTDLIPIGGRNKFYYVLFYLTCGITATIMLGSLPFDVVRNNPIIGALLFFGMHVNADSTDVLFESKNVQLMQKYPHIRTDLFTFSWTCDNIGQIFPNFFVGILAENYDVRLSFFIFLPFFFIPFPFLFMGGLIEDKSEKFRGIINTKILHSHWRIVIMSLVIFIISATSMAVTWLYSDIVQLIYGITTEIIVLVLAFILLDFSTAKFFSFLALTATFTLDINTARDYYYRDDVCAEDGPAFSYIIINTWSPIIKNIIQFISVFCFQVIFDNTNFRKVYAVTIAVRIFASFFDLLIVLRFTKSIGIPDSLVYLLGDATIGMLASQFIHQISTYLSAKYCPRHLEASMYALLATPRYVGEITAKFLGLVLINSFGIVSEFDPKNNVICNYDNLWKIIIIGSIITPLLSFPLIYLCIPNIKFNEVISRESNNENNEKNSITEIKIIKEKEILSN